MAACLVLLLLAREASAAYYPLCSSEAMMPRDGVQKLVLFDRPLNYIPLSERLAYVSCCVQAV